VPALPIDRDRRRAKRRYTRRQAAQAAQAASRRRRRQILGAVIAVAVLAAGIYGISRMFGGETAGSSSDSTGASSQSTAVHGRPALITYGDWGPSADAGGRTLNGSETGTVTKGLDILTQIAQGGTANGTSEDAAARPIRFESSTVTPR
jgi:hypothetical protein